MHDQFNPIIDDFQREIEDVIDSILGEKASRSKREELNDLIYNILHKYEEKYLDYLKYAIHEDLYQPLPTNSRNCNKFTKFVALVRLQRKKGEAN